MSNVANTSPEKHSEELENTLELDFFENTESAELTLPGEELDLSSQSSGEDVLERSEEHTSELQSLTNLVCRLLLEKKKKKQ